MIETRHIGRVALAALLLSTTAARADLTAEDVWASWTGYYEALGMPITATSQGREGDTLVITGATMGSAMPDGSSFTATFPEVRMTEMGDGRVEVTFAAEMPVTMVQKPASGETVNMSMLLTQEGMSMIASGDPENMAYDMKVPTFGVSVSEMSVDGAAVPLKLDAVMTGGTGKYQMVTAGGRAVTSEFSAEKFTLDVSAQDPAGTGSFAMTGEFGGLSGTSNANVPEGVDMTDMNAAVKAGFSADGGFSYTSATYRIDFTDAAEQGTATVSDKGGNLTLALSQNGLSYGGGNKDLAVSITSMQIPVPVDFTLAEAAFNLAMPVTKSDTAQPFAFLTRLVDLSVSDGIWGMIDPAGQLPHDPATLVLDVNGMGKLNVDFMDPAMMAPDAPPPVNPGEIEAVTLNALQLRAAGAELTGSGAATFDNSAGVPVPLGAVDLKLVGANALIDKLVAMGLLPEDQAMGARMMMGMFAVPAGDDVLTSKIEFREGGSIFANGQQIQ
jgi:hypothetical protein